MLQIEHHLFPHDLAEAYRTLSSTPGAVVLGGCGYIRLGDRALPVAIDLSRLGLDTVRDTGNTLEIGAMTPLRTLETSPVCQNLFDGVLGESVKNIVGVQLRHLVTVGGTVAGRFPFSDPLTALLALNAELEFHHHGRISLEEYLAGKTLRDILVKVIIAKGGQRGSFQSIRRSKTDYAVLNAAACRQGDDLRIVVGARPGRAMLVPEAAAHLHDRGLTAETAREAGAIAARTLQFGDNPRGSGRYRQTVCPVLVTRALMEVCDAA